MIPDASMSCFGLEYFCSDGDDLWAMDDAALVALATDEMVRLGLVARVDVMEGVVVRQPKAYPVYDAGYREVVSQLRALTEGRHATLHCAGRNGLHRYNNQDHSMMTAMLAVRNILAGERVCDVWAVNEEAVYVEG